MRSRRFKSALSSDPSQRQQANEQAAQAIAKLTNVPVDQARTQVQGYEDQYDQLVATREAKGRRSRRCRCLGRLEGCARRRDLVDRGRPGRVLRRSVRSRSSSIAPREDGVKWIAATLRRRDLVPLGFRAVRVMTASVRASHRKGYHLGRHRPQTVDLGLIGDAIRRPPNCFPRRWSSRRPSSGRS